jgi:hypothetical protein
MAAGPNPIVYDADGLHPDLATVNALARVQLAAGRLGLELRLRRASPQLCTMLAFAGLAEILRVEAGGQPVEREQRLGVEEERQLGDPPL